MRILLLTPPMTQINTPYPATAYLTGFLKTRGYDVIQRDPGIELALRIFSRAGLDEILGILNQKYSEMGLRPTQKVTRFFLKNFKMYLSTVDATIEFLQGSNPTLAYRIANRGYLPEGPRFDVLKDIPSDDEDPLCSAFGALGIRDRAQYLASLFIDDLADLVRLEIDEKFELAKYGEKLAASSAHFDSLLSALSTESVIDRWLNEITEEMFRTIKPDVIGFSVPFPGNVYGAFRMAKRFRQLAPTVPVVMGGGYVNTELRELTDVRVFDFVDFIPLDDGEGPLIAILEHLSGKTTKETLLRTLVKIEGTVKRIDCPTLHDIPFRETGAPSYEGLPLGNYLSLCELLNPMNRLWTDGRWNKLTVAHGCYWKKCSFCDVSLDYIGRYETQPAALIVDKMEKIIAETGESGFHFVDEAAPPKALIAVAEEVLKRGLQVTWWGNIRFEKAFTFEVAELLARSGCIAMSGGLEVASDRLLALMEKGVTVAQVAQVTSNFARAGIMVHAYLMYGFPSQTVQETIDALERVRQLFAEGCIQSAFWHRFSVTVHSPVGKNPEKFGITLNRTVATFAKNDLEFTDKTGIDHDSFQPGLKKAVYNYMHGIGLDEDVRFWFDFPIPKAKVAKNLVANFLKEGDIACH